MSFAGIMGALGAGIGQGVKQAAQYSGQAAARANGISAAAQAAQGAFNQASANNANAIGSDRIAEQYGFNSGQAAAANAFTQQMWQQSADWNANMFAQQMEFNAAEAQKQREWQEYMASTAYQRAVKDMSKAGLNPILAVTGGGISTGSGGGSAASVSSPQMSGANGAMASGGLMNGIAASEGNYTGQMEYLGGWLGLMSALSSGLSSAFSAFSQMGALQGAGGETGYSFMNFLSDLLTGNKDSLKNAYDNPYTYKNQFESFWKEGAEAWKNRNEDKDRLRDWAQRAYPWYNWYRKQ